MNKFESFKNYSFLKDKNFRVVHSRTDVDLGSFIVDLESDYFSLRYGQDRMIDFVDISSNIDKGRGHWYDLALLKALILKETVLNKVTTLNDLNSFLENEFIKIKEMFDSANYPKTKSELESIQKLRARQMFPRLKDRF